MGAPVPSNPIVRPFGYSAGGAFITFPVPQTTATPGRASYEQGFPPTTMTAKVAGGIPPWGQDFNGLMKQVTEQLVMINAGQPMKYDATVVAAISGYNRGAILAMSDDTGLWISLENANTDDPDAAGGSAKWAPVYRYDSQPFTGLTGGIVTATYLQSRSWLLELSGTLMSNLQLVLPAMKREWLVVNSTTGSGTVTVRTPGGTGVVIPNGGYANASAIYGNGVDIFLNSAAITIPASVNPTNNSIVQRTNTGGVLATAFSDLSDFVNTFGARLITGGGPWYYTLPGGFILQFGRALNVTNGENRQITYATPFPNQFFIAIAGGTNTFDAGAQDNAVDAYTTSNMTLTGFRLTSARDGNTNAHWFALGR